MHSCRRKRRSANSVAASLPRRSVAAPTASQRRSRVAASQRRSVAPASQRRSANSVAASLQRRSVAAPTVSQRHWPNGSVAASQRRSATRPPERRSVAAPPAPGSVTAQRRKPTLRPPLPLHCAILSHLSKLTSGTAHKNKQQDGKSGPKTPDKNKPNNHNKRPKKDSEAEKAKERTEASSSRTDRAPGKAARTGGRKQHRPRRRAQAAQAVSFWITQGEYLSAGRKGNTPNMCDFGALLGLSHRVSYLTEFMYGGFCDRCLFCLVSFNRHSNPEDETMDDTMLSPFFKAPNRRYRRLPWTHGWTQSP